ncbi:glycosyltransferase [Shewanella japonica]|nr:glycosyltransferase [Shewanella japonica]
MTDKLFVFNCSSNVVGGAVQNSVNFIKQIYTRNEQEQWYFILSEVVFRQVGSFVSTDRHSVFSSPAKSFLSRVKIKLLVNKLNPFLVYTSAGPSYINFNCTHIMGCSNPYVLGPSRASLSILGGIYSQVKRRLHSLYQLYHFRKSDYWIVQTEVSLNQLIAKGFPEKNIFVVYNSVSLDFLTKKNQFEDLSNKKDIKVLVPSAYYPHKNLSIIPKILNKLNKPGATKFSFFLTVEPSAYEYLIQDPEFNQVQQHLTNLGPYKHKDAVDLYCSHDVIFLPSLLEVFSTSYIESMAIKKPLILPSLEFTQGICSNYPLYYDTDSIDSCIESFNQIGNYYKFSEKYVLVSETLITKYGSQNERYTKISNILFNLK